MKKNDKTSLQKLEKKRMVKLSLFFSLLVFVTLVCALFFACAIVLSLYLIFGAEAFSPLTILLYMILISVFIGFFIALPMTRIHLYPFANIINQLNRLANGDYTARLTFKKMLLNQRTFRELSSSFNKLAGELENTEMLRADFINNFSHEFKTPIVSIAGFAKLLKRGNLSDEQRAEYIEIIESESMRLSRMATNMLELTKIDNQSILTDVKRYNLSEQIRSSVLLLEDKWMEKDVGIDIDIGEYYISANEQLLKQVWINLLDNAVKFSHSGESVDITATETDTQIRIGITNKKYPISEQDKAHLFDKFYQADRSHSSDGNGIGLAIVMKILKLHEASIDVESDEELTTFTVSLNK